MGKMNQELGNDFSISQYEIRAATNQSDAGRPAHRGESYRFTQRTQSTFYGFFAFAAASLMYFSGSSLNSSRQPEQHTQ